MEQSNGNQNSILDEINALDKIISIAIDYYCFKNNISEEPDFPIVDKADEWKKGTKYEQSNEQNNVSSNEIIPKKINDLIELAIEKKLKKLT